METPADERKRFDHIAWLISSSVDEISMQGCLALDVIERVHAHFIYLFYEFLHSKMVR